MYYTTPTSMFRRPMASMERRYLARQLCPDPVVKRVTRGEDANPLWAFAQHVGHGAPEGARPRQGVAMDQLRGQGEVTLPPEHDFGTFHQCPSGRAQAGYPILADADDGQPPC